MTRDRQRSRVYAWEDRHISPADRTLLPYSLAEGMIQAIWAELGLRYPPAVEPLPHRSRCLGDATRLSIRLASSFPSWCLLHEVAHSLTSTHEGHSDGHGAHFMGLYVKLLARYMRLDGPKLTASARASGLMVEADAVPAFVDPVGSCSKCQPPGDKPSRRGL